MFLQHDPDWDRDDKIPVYRHPLSQYRLFKREDLERCFGKSRNRAGIRLDGGVAPSETGSHDEENTIHEFRDALSWPMILCCATSWKALGENYSTFNAHSPVEYFAKPLSIESAGNRRRKIRRVYSASLLWRARQ